MPLGVVALLGLGFTFCDVSGCLVVCLLVSLRFDWLEWLFDVCYVLMFVGWICLFCARVCRGWSLYCLVWVVVWCVVLLAKAGLGCLYDCVYLLVILHVAVGFGWIVRWLLLTMIVADF